MERINGRTCSASAPFDPLLFGGRDMTPIRRAILVATLTALPLAACDNAADQTKVTLVFRDIGYDSSYFTAAPTVAEVHNGPFDGVTAQQVAAMIRLPQSYPAGLKFAWSAPDATPKPRIRLVVAFNSRSPYPGEAMCRGDDSHGSQALGAPSPYDQESYMVDMALCRDELALASASMEARTTQTRDAAFVERTFNHMMNAVFGSLAERDDP
ncbi:MAG: hypothetical protein ACI9ZH_001141 [Paracoccaceae bacterium]|jgi:hypothetical protein